MKYTIVDYLAVYQFYPLVAKGIDNKIVQRRLQTTFSHFIASLKRTKNKPPQRPLAGVAASIPESMFAFLQLMLLESVPLLPLGPHGRGLLVVCVTARSQRSCGNSDSQIE